MIGLPSGVRVWLACGYTDMRKGMDGLAMPVQQGLAVSTGRGSSPEVGRENSPLAGLWVISL